MSEHSEGAKLVIAYPELTPIDDNKIQNYRNTHDELFFKVVDPHFTFVFAVFDVPDSEFISEVKTITKDTRKIPFVMRCATINKDEFRKVYHTFLVPDEGHSHILKLHNKLYSGKFKYHLRLDIDYIPHIGIGNSIDKHFCKKMADEWNERDFTIPGIISKLTIINYANNIVTKLDEINLL